MPTYTPEQFAAVLESAVARCPRETVNVLRRGGKNIKAEARRNAIASSGTSAAGAPYKIEYSEPVAEGTRLSVTVGYEGSGQAKLGVLLEYGGGGDHSPPHRDLGRALESEDGRFVAAMGDMAERLLD